MSGKFVGRLIAPIAVSAPPSPTKGQVYYNSTDDLTYVYKPTGWTAIGSGSGGSYLLNYTLTNITTDKVYDVTATSVNELANVLGTVIYDLTTTAVKLAGYTVTNSTALRTYDAANVSMNDLANVLATVIADLSSDRALNGYRIFNLSLDRTINTGVTTINELANVLGTLIVDLGGGQAQGSTNKYTTTVGDGANTTYTVAHGLSSQTVDVIVREAVSPFEEVLVQVKFASTNSLTLTFSTAPTTNQYHVTCTAGYTAQENFTAGKYVATIGDGSTNPITITHNFASRNVTIQVYEAATPYTQVLPLVTLPSLDTAQLTFDTIPTSGQYSVIVTAGTQATQQATVSTQSVLDVGVPNQVRAGRPLTLADFTTNMGLSTPVGLWNLNDLTDVSGNGRTLTNKGTVTFGSGVSGAATEAAIFTGVTTQALHSSDASFAIKTGSWGCWFQTLKRGSDMYLLTKDKSGAGNRGYGLWLNTSNQVVVYGETSGSVSATTYAGVTDVADGRWHWIVGTFDGTVLRLYIDGSLEAAGSLTGSLTATTAALTLGGSDGSAVSTTLPVNGKLDEAFVLNDVLNEDQVRYLYCSKIAHGFSSVPSEVVVGVRRRKRGGPLVTSDFPIQPKVSYGFTGGALTDAGSLGTTLTNTNTAISVAGADGQTGGAFQFNGTNQYLVGTDTGLPSGTVARTLLCWYKTTATAAVSIMSYGATSLGANFLLNSSAQLNFGDYSTTTFVVDTAATNDGQWHMGVAVVDNAAVDGLKVKLYRDGKLVASTTTAMSSTALAGASGLKVGASNNATGWWPGTVDSVAITDYALTPEQIYKLYNVGSLSLGVSPKNAGDHVERIDSVNIYATFDGIDGQNQVDLKVRA